MQMHRQLILEGSDGAGKTTFARKLEAEGWRVRHVGPPSTNNFGQEVLDLLASVDGPTVWDRLYLGEFVYGPYRNNVGIRNGDFNLIEAWLKTSGAINLWFNTPATVCHERVGPAGTPNALFSQEEAYIRYHSVFIQRSKVNFCTTSSFADDSARISWCTKFLSDMPFTAFDVEGIGADQPQLWVLGEQMNPRAKIQQPFSTAAGRALVWPAINIETTRVSNALQVNSCGPLSRARFGHFEKEDLHNLRCRWELLTCPRVIALGEVAKKMCAAAGVPATSMPHPQFAWRFDSKNRQVYLEQMIEAAA